MATIDLGKIKFVNKGAYNNSTAYTPDDVVTSGGSSYICKLASQGNAVTNGTYWDVLAQAGTDVGTTLTTQGDILYRDGSGLQRLAAGTAGQVLRTGGSGANVSWVDQAGGHLVSFHTDSDQTNETTTSSSFVTTNLSITITPASASSKFFIMCTFQGGNNTAQRRSYYSVFYGGSEIAASAMNHEFVGATSNENPSALSILHSPNTTSAVTYDIRMKANGGGDTAKMHYKNMSIFEFAS